MRIRRWPSTLRWHVAVLMLIGMLPVFLFAAAMLALYVRDQRGSLERDLLESARLLSVAVDTELRQSIVALEVLSLVESLTVGDLEAFYYTAQDVVNSQPMWANMLLTGPAGEHLLNLQVPFGKSLPPLNRPELGIETARSLRPKIFGAIVGVVSGRQLTQVAVPVVRDGQAKYVLVAATEARAWGLFLAERTAPPRIASLADHDLRIVARTARSTEELPGAHSHPATAEAAKGSPSGFLRIRTAEGGDSYGAYHKSPYSGWVTAVYVPEAALGPLIRYAGFVAAGGFVLFALLGLLLAMALAPTIARPIAQLTGFVRSLEAMAERAQQAPVALAPRSDIDEVRELGQAFSESAEKLHSELVSRHRSEEALYAKTQQLESLVTSAPLGLAFFDREHRYLQVNGELAAMNGIAAADHVGHSIEELLPVNARTVAPVLDRVFETGEVIRNFEVAGETPREPGVPRHWLTGFYPIRDEHGKVVMAGAWVTEITAIKQTEQALHDARVSAEQAKAEAEKANHAKDQFLAVLSHELRTPLTPVLAAVDLLQRQGEVNGQTRNSLDIIRRNVQLQARLIDDLLDLTRIAQGKLELKRKPINLCTVIERAVEVAKPDIDARQLHFGVEVKDPPHRVEADASRLQQVIWNLLTNAVKFTPDGGCVGLRCARVNRHVVIEVTDSGIGIEPGAAERIFDAFEQGGPGITRQFGGLGLGLAIARRLVQMHDGSISVHSEGRNRGSTFRVHLPLSSAPLHAEQQERVQVAGGGSKRILLVEDNGDTALTLRLLLENLGYQVQTAGDLKQALEIVEAGSFDLLISDLGLPDGTGIDLMHELKRRGRDLKAIAMSGYGQREDVRRSREAGFRVHLTKPVSAEALLETVAAIL